MDWFRSKTLPVYILHAFVIIVLTHQLSFKYSVEINIFISLVLAVLTCMVLQLQICERLIRFISLFVYKPFMKLLEILNPKRALIKALLLINCLYSFAQVHPSALTFQGVTLQFLLDAGLLWLPHRHPLRTMSRQQVYQKVQLAHFLTFQFLPVIAQVHVDLCSLI